MTKEGRVVVVASAVHCCDCSDFAGVESEDGPCFFIFRRRAVAGEKKKRDHGVQSVRMRDRTRSGDGAIFVQSGTSKSRQAILVCGPFFCGQPDSVFAGRCAATTQLPALWLFCPIFLPLQPGVPHQLPRPVLGLAPLAPINTVKGAGDP